MKRYIRPRYPKIWAIERHIINFIQSYTNHIFSPGAESSNDMWRVKNSQGDIFCDISRLLFCQYCCQYYHQTSKQDIMITTQFSPASFLVLLRPYHMLSISSSSRISWYKVDKIFIHRFCRHSVYWPYHMLSSKQDISCKQRSWSNLHFQVLPVEKPGAEHPAEHERLLGAQVSNLNIVLLPFKVGALNPWYLMVGKKTWYLSFWTFN